MQILKGICGDVRCAKFHPSAESSIDHPVGQCYDCAWSNFEMQYITITAAALFVQPQTTPIAGMPAIVDFNLLPDLGRMTVR